jgi:hypothetical protein
MYSPFFISGTGTKRTVPYLHLSMVPQSRTYVLCSVEPSVQDVSHCVMLHYGTNGVGGGTRIRILSGQDNSNPTETRSGSTTLGRGRIMKAGGRVNYLKNGLRIKKHLTLYKSIPGINAIKARFESESGNGA